MSIITKDTYLMHLIGRRVRAKQDHSMQVIVTGFRREHGTLFLQISDGKERAWVHSGIADGVEFV